MFLDGVMLELPLVAVISLMCGGLGLFLFGCTFLSSNLKSLVDGGDTFRRLISKSTNNRLKACGVGVGFTALIQSSGGTSALSIGLVKAGALDYKGAIAIIIGANVGTCITAFLIAIPGISQFMPFITFAAALIMMIIHSRKGQLWSKLAFAFSLIFFGIWLIESNVKAAINGQDWFISLLEFLNLHPFVGLLFGTGVTLVLQSSSAVIGVTQGILAAALASNSSSITLFGILPLVFGANIGAVIPSILTAIGGSPTAKRVAFLNTFMKVVTAILFMGVLYACYYPLQQSNTWGIEPKLQIALGHLIFNLTSAVIFLPLLKPICLLGEKVFKDKSVGEKIEFKELDPQVIKTFPSTGISLAQDLSFKMFDYVKKMFVHMSKYALEGDEEEKEYCLNLEKAVDHIDRHLADFLIHAETGTLTYSDHIKYNRIMRAIKDIERIGDYGETLIGFYSSIIDKRETLDDVQLKEMTAAHQSALEIINQTIEMYKNSDKVAALDIIQKRRDFISELDSFQNNHFERESKKDGETQKISYVSMIYVDMLNSYERVYAHCSNIAKLYNSDKKPGGTSKKDSHIFAAMSSRY